MDRRRGREWGGTIIGRTRRRSRPMTGPHPACGRSTTHSRQLCAQNGRGEGMGERDQGSATAIASTRGRQAGESLPPPLPSDTAGQSVDVVGGWAREMAGSGRVSGSVAHLSKRRRAARRRDAIADRMPGMGDHRPAVGRGRTMAVGTFDVCSNAAVNSDLSCFLYTLLRQTEAAVFALPGRLSSITVVISSWRHKHLFPLPLPL